MVVVGGEAQLDLAGRQTVVFGLVGCNEVAGGTAVAEYVDERILVVPAVVHVEATHGEVVRALALGQHHNMARSGSSAQRVDSFFPEVGRHAVGHVAAETVDAHLNHPELHGVDHGKTHVAVVVVQVGHVVPVPGTRMNDGVSLSVVGVPVRMGFQPGVIPGRVVGHPVEYDAHLMLVAHADKVLEVVDGAELRCYCLVVADAVG